MCSSSPEQTMPSDVIPPNSRRPTSPVGSLPPAATCGTISPTLRLVAPVTTVTLRPPRSTRATFRASRRANRYRLHALLRPRDRPSSAAGAAQAAPPRSAPARAASSAALSFELLQETQIVGVKLADIVDAVLDHGDAFDAHAPGEAGQTIGVISHPLQYARMDNTGAEDLPPAGSVADRAVGVRAVT